MWREIKALIAAMGSRCLKILSIRQSNTPAALLHWPALSRNLSKRQWEKFFYYVLIHYFLLIYYIISSIDILILPNLDIMHAQAAPRAI